MFEPRTMRMKPCSPHVAPQLFFTFQKSLPESESEP